MKVGVLGLGKLGLPVALALAHAGHEVVGWDANAERLSDIGDRSTPECAYEPLLEEYLRKHPLLIARNFTEHRPQIILVCVQTPHEPGFGGETVLTDHPCDFDYSWLETALSTVTSQIRAANTSLRGNEHWDPLLVCVSTCLPGTFERLFRRMLDGNPDPDYPLHPGTPPRTSPIRFAYHPLFVAMGSVIPDFCRPEFLLCGTDEQKLPWELRVLYEEVYYTMMPSERPAPYKWALMSVTSAELTKVAYNAFIGFKLMFANELAMLCETVSADVDDVVSTLKQADRRLISSAYLHPGMGDGGACHPRDQIALSWLADNAHVHDAFNPFEMVIDAREDHARWLVYRWRKITRANGALPMFQLGSSYKPDNPLRDGSHALLVAQIARPDWIGDDPPEQWPVASYFLATPHTHFLEAIRSGQLPEGSVLVDPWGLIEEAPGVTVIRLGRPRARGV